MRPTMVADLKAHLLDLGDLVPRHKIRLVIHPPVRDKECRAEAQFFEQRRYKGAVRLHRVIKAKHYKFVGNGPDTLADQPGGLEELFIFPAAMPKIEQTETGKGADGKREPSGPIRKSLERAAILELKRRGQPLLEQSRAVHSTNLQSQRVIIKRQGEIIVRV